MDELSLPPTETIAKDASSGSQRRRHLLWLLTAIVTMAGLAAITHWALHGRFHETTNDAYVGGDIVQVTSQVAGVVTAVTARDTEFVRAGTPLVKLDETDGRVALENAAALLARAVRDVRSLLATQAALQAQLEQREIDAALARDNLARRRNLAGSGALPAEDIANAESRLAAAEGALRQAREQALANEAQIAGTTVGDHPAVRAAAARYKEAFLAHRRTTIVAPVSGHVAKRTVHPGQRIGPGIPLMAVVPLDGVWVDANFKEVQLARMRIGQTAVLQADVYGSDVEYRGRIVGLGAGTGAAFAILPAQNATGNWIKVVQRVPVRIALERGQLQARPLRIGLSMSVEVDTRGGDNPATETQPARGAASLNADNADALAQAEAESRQIIADNLAPPARANRPAKRP